MVASHRGMQSIYSAAKGQNKSKQQVTYPARSSNVTNVSKSNAQ